MNKLPIGTTLLSLFTFLQISSAQNSAFTYQGRLSANGIPVKGLYDLRFMVFALPSGGGGGSVVAGPITNSATLVHGGVFTVTLDFGNDVFDGQERWIEIGVRTNGAGAFTTLRPRQPITATPYALRAANYAGPVAVSQVTGALPTAQLSGTVADAQLSANVALVKANQTFAGTNNFNNPGNTFTGNGLGLTGLSADHITSGTIADERLSPNVALLNQGQKFLGDQTSSASLRLDGPGTNNWLILSNGSLWLPPFAQPNEEDGADGQRGGIYFASAGSTGGTPNNNHYILNIVHRGGAGGTLLLSHESIAVEENYGAITLGNDGTDGGSIVIRYDDAFGVDVQPGQQGHSKPLIFSARTKDTNGVLFPSYPAIVGFHGGTPFNYPGGSSLGDGGFGELRFYTRTPMPVWGGIDESLGKEMGRMETNGWNFRGTMTYQKSSVLVNSGTNYALDFGTNNYIEITLNTSPVKFTTLNPHGGTNNAQSLTLILNAGNGPRAVSFPPWKVLSQNGTVFVPTNLPALSTTVVRLDVLGAGGDANTLARFETYQ